MSVQNYKKKMTYANKKIRNKYYIYTKYIYTLTELKVLLNCP